MTYRGYKAEGPKPNSRAAKWSRHPASPRNHTRSAPMHEKIKTFQQIISNTTRDKKSPKQYIMSNCVKYRTDVKQGYKRNLDPIHGHTSISSRKVSRVILTHQEETITLKVSSLLVSNNLFNNLR